MNGISWVVLTSMLCIVNFGASAQVISDVTGVVELKYQLNSPWRPVDLGENLLPDSALRTFNGQVSLRFPNNDLIRLDANTELQLSPEGVLLKHGKAYVNGWKLRIHTTSEILLTGEGRIDFDEQERIAILSGEAQIKLPDQVIYLTNSEQIVIDGVGAVHHSKFSETEPWYRNLSILGEGKGHIIGIKGQAEISRGNGWQNAKPEMLVEVGTSLRTHDATWLELRFDDDNLIRLQANTELVLKTLEDLENGLRQTVLELVYGKVWVIVETEGQPFQIETPGLIAGVRGTKFRLDAAEANEPALIKTFDGLVAGSQGFETTFVEEGKQFDSLAGLKILQIDELDQFNLNRDELLKLPQIRLEPVPSLTSNDSLTLSGNVTPGVRLSLGSQTQVAQSEDFLLNTKLKPGFNLLELYVYNDTSPDPRKLVFPVVRSSRDIFVDALLKPFASGYVLNGVAPAGARIQIDTGFEQIETVADASSRFTVRLNKVADIIQLRAELQSGESAQKEVMIRP